MNGTSLLIVSEELLNVSLNYGSLEAQNNFRRNLVLPTLAAMGFPVRIPLLQSLGPHVPEASTINGVDEIPFINPVLDYNWDQTQPQRRFRYSH